MFAHFRQAMTWLHTWAGLVLGYLLVVVFFFGSLSVFDREIDRWALPETRFPAQPMPSYDRVLAPIFAAMKPDAAELEGARRRVVGALPSTLPAKEWGAYTTHRDPVLALYAEYAVAGNPADPDDHVHGFSTVDPRDGHALKGDPLKLGTGFFYPMHIGLTLTWNDVGYWIVGVAALAMLAALVTGLVIHRKVFREFFTFRPDRHRQRSVLDLHNLTGVVALPFHFFFALSGLTIFAGMYLPVSTTVLKPMAEAALVADAKSKGLPFAPAGTPAALASVDAMVAEAKRRWAARDMAGEVGFLQVHHVGDRNAYVSVFRAGSDRVSFVGQAIHFDGPSGRVLYEEPAPSAVAAVNEFLTGLHLQHFRHWLLRWFYVFGGLAGCVCIATGFVFFVQKRKRHHAAAGLGGARWADAFAVATVCGTVVATCALLVANRALPEALPERDLWQRGVFWGAWALAFAHAAWRSGPLARGAASPAWREQAWTIAALAPLAVVLNAVTTGDHLLRTIAAGYWPVAGVDLSLLALACIAAAAAHRLGRAPVDRRQPTRRRTADAARA